MTARLYIVLFLLLIALFDQSTSAESAKPREKRSPKPQFGKLIGTFIARWASQVAKKIPTVIKLAKNAASTVGNFVSKNPGTVAAGTVGVGVGVGVSALAGKKQCRVRIRTDLPDKQPVFINEGTPRSLMVPKDGYLTWDHGVTSWIACPPSAGTQNSISNTNKKVETITCDSGLIFQMNGIPVNISTITCVQRVTGNYEARPDQQCMGTNKAIGFNVPFPTGNQFFKLFYSCFNEAGASTLFTHHVLFGSEIDHKCISQSGRPDFKSTGFPDGFSVRTVYNQLNQSQRLTALFSTQISNGNAQTDAQRYYDVSYLQRGHLTPDGDELFTTWQWSTYFFINVVGMWEQINIGNWKTLETKVRTLANDAKVNFDIYTGTYGTLALCSSTNFCPDFTLANGGIPVPKWLWKIVKAPMADAAIALVVSNNPFVPVQSICGTRQIDYGWRQNGFDNFVIGEVSYCTVQELQSVVGYIPQAAMATHVLAFQ